MDALGQHGAGEQDGPGGVESGDHGNHGEVTTAGREQEEQVSKRVQHTGGGRQSQRGPLLTQALVHDTRRCEGHSRGHGSANDQRRQAALGRRLVQADQLQGDGGARSQGEQQSGAGGTGRAEP